MHSWLDTTARASFEVCSEPLVLSQKQILGVEVWESNCQPFSRDSGESAG